MRLVTTITRWELRLAGSSTKNQTIIPEASTVCSPKADDEKDNFEPENNRDKTLQQLMLMVKVNEANLGEEAKSPLLGSPENVTD